MKLELPQIKLGFRGKVYLGIISIILLSGFLMALSVSTLVSEALSREFKNRGTSLAVNLAARSQDPILTMDSLRMKDLITQVVNSGDDILYAFILDDKGQVLSHNFDGGFPVELKTANTVSENQDCNIRRLDTGEYLVHDFATPIFIGNHRLGTVRIGLLGTKARETIQNLLSMILMLTGLSILIAGLAGAAFADQVTKRIKTLQQASEEVLRGNLDVQSAPALKKTCSELINCNNTACPAYGSNRRRCWYLVGTMSPNYIERKRANRVKNCKDCAVYKANSGDEIQHLAESFDAMTMALKDHISRLAQSKATLEKSERKYRRIFEASMDTIFVADPQGNFLDINQAGIAMLGCESKEIVLQSVNLDDILLEPDSFQALCEEIACKSFIKDRECTLRAMNGHELQVLFSCTAHTDGKGRLISYEGIIKDITRRRNMERQLLQADKLASIGQLSAGVAHEINNPLGLILGYTQLLLRGERNGSQNYKDLKTIEKHARNCKAIVEALLSFARRTETKRVPIDINQTIQKVVAVVERQFELDNVHIDTHFDETIPLFTGDAEKLKQVFMNLLMNARQAMSKSNAGQIVISTAFARPQGEIHVTIQDTGSGIPRKIINKIFDPFFTTKPTGRGTGLGLSISYGIIKEHNGQISVQSEPGKGSTFTVTLPVCLAEGGQA
ncbi:MAG: PAS domain S-box protein [Deltaproteobacteria bacterium]|nr:PAS domain S-box protein [Deltaproteobacteria bacterium]RLB92055.1 MAG: PAS domain-containing sensor histidine kinase [Deltaproteobacteria bacterium]RLC12155.1 MAG: PAS domain-containing sensor histidine kinase [Deltaproteobacteria bacterium]